MEVQHSETKVQGDTKKRRGLLGTPTSILIRLLFFFIEMIEIKDRDEYCNQFLDTFHFQLNWYAEVHQRFLEGEPKVFISLDIFKFEKKMKEKGYKDGALKEFVESKYWKEADVLIDKLL